MIDEATDTETGPTPRGYARARTMSHPARQRRGQVGLSSIVDDDKRCMTRELPGGSGSIPAAREYARDFLERAEPAVAETTVQDALLAISELVTNVVRHAPGPCTLRLALDEGYVHIAVSDTSSVVPRAKPPQPEGLGGFGLHMLRKLAGEVETRVHASGKTVSVSLARGRAG